MSEADDLPRILSGRYRLEATLGQGGMGVVYRGTDLMMKRPVAVKLIRAVDGVDLDEDVAGRFLREAKNTARLQHEHIIEVYDLGRTDGSGLYFVMELLEGESLAARLRRDGKLSPETTVHIGRQICEALEVAHSAGVIHRDLKPANIMLLSRAGDDEFVKVLDFGVAKSFGPAMQDETQLTHTGMLVGTLDYMAPEQIMGKPIDGRTDVYALGVLFYRMLSGQAPFKDNGVPALIHAHMNTMPKPLIEVAKGIPNELDHVILRCLAKKPERRFESMSELARALAHAVMPESGHLVSLDAGADDYDDGDKTAVVHTFGTGDGPPPPLPRSLAVPIDDSTINHRRVPASMNGHSFEDATVKMDRPVVLLNAPGATPRVDGAPRPASKRPPMPRPPRRFDDSEVTRIDQGSSRTCAMCQTTNPAHVHVCGACGVSLSVEEQDAVRARVRTDAPPGHAPPGPPGTARVPYDSMGRSPMPSHPPIYGAPGPHYGNGVGMPPPNAPWMPQGPPQAMQRPSMWQRFLVWTGLRPR
jgi:serine/threonine protein kinase